MAKGTIYPSEKSEFRDQETGVTVHRLTNYYCHSSHLYFTHLPYYAGGRKMLFYSDRGNARNIFGLDMDSGEIRQLTGFEPGDAGVQVFGACVNPARDEAYFWAGGVLHAIDLTDLSERRIWERPHGMLSDLSNCSCDGEFVYFVLSPDMTDRLPFDPLKGRVASKVYHAVHPHCRIVRVPTIGGEPETLWEEDYWLGHLNASPVEPNMFTFCHEGPWAEVDQRMWGIDANTGSVWKIRPETGHEIIGHEYWFADGSRVGYHGRTSEGVRLWGHADPRGGSFEEYPIPRPTMHTHSLDARLIVSDGSPTDPFLVLWRWNGEGYDGALLHRHMCSFHGQQLHVHPAMTPDGKGVVFTSDIHGYGDIHYIELPGFESLPPALEG